MKSMHKQRTPRPAFTLIEMMIVIAIIGLLAALTLGISSSVLRNSEIRQTENAVKILTMAMQEWELEMGRSMEFEGVPESADTGMYDLYASGLIDYPGFNQQGIDNQVMTDAMKNRAVSFMYVLTQSESATTVLAKMESDLIVKDNDGTFVADAWGNPIGIDIWIQCCVSSSRYRLNRSLGYGGIVEASKNPRNLTVSNRQTAWILV